MSKIDPKLNEKRRNVLKAGIALSCASLFGSCLQNTNEAGGEETVRVLSQDGHWIDVAKSQISPVDQILVSNKEARQGIQGRKFVMVIDLAKCNNARKCVIACQKMHHQPEDKEWLQIKLLKDHEAGAPYWFPKACFHCDNPPCVKVCPVDATFKRTDGIVLIDNERCIGCKFCMAACPYSTRVFQWDEPEQPYESTMCVYSPESSVPGQVGTVDKCDFCPDMARLGKLPDCVTACPNGAFYFGDQNEDIVTNGSETVRFSQLIKEKGGYRFMEELGTEPRVYYLPPADKIFPVERGFENLTDELKERYKNVEI